MSVFHSTQALERCVKTHADYDLLPLNFKLLALHTTNSDFNVEHTRAYYEQEYNLFLEHLRQGDLEALPSIIYECLHSSDKKNQYFQEKWYNFFNNFSAQSKQAVYHNVSAALQIEICGLDKKLAKKALSLLKETTHENNTPVIYWSQVQKRNEAFILNYLLEHKKYDKIDMALSLEFITPSSLHAALLLRQDYDAIEKIEELNYFSLLPYEFKNAYNAYFFALIPNCLEPFGTASMSSHNLDIQKKYIAYLSIDNQKAIAYLQNKPETEKEFAKFASSFSLSSLATLCDKLYYHVESGILNEKKCFDIFSRQADMALDYSEIKMSRAAKPQEGAKYMGNLLAHFFYMQQKKENSAHFLWEPWSHELLKKIITKPGFTAYFTSSELISATQQEFDKNLKSLSRPEAIEAMEKAKQFFSIAAEKALLQNMILSMPETFSTNSISITNSNIQLEPINTITTQKHKI